MPLPGKTEATQIFLRFGAGINTTVSEVEIDERECAGGENFGLALDNNIFFRR